MLLAGSDATLATAFWLEEEEDEDEDDEEVEAEKEAEGEVDGEEEAKQLGRRRVPLLRGHSPAITRNIEVCTRMREKSKSARM